MDKYVYVHRCIRKYILILMDTGTLVYLHVYINIHICVFTFTYIYIFVYINTKIYICRYVYM